jgi:hypothetical protein
VSVFVADAACAACALPSAPKVMKLALSNVVAASRTGAKRMRMACLRCSSGLRWALVIRRRPGTGWVRITLLRITCYICIISPPDHSGAPGRGIRTCTGRSEPGRAPSNRCGAGRSVRARRRSAETGPDPAKTSAVSCSGWPPGFATQRWSCARQRAATAIACAPGSGSSIPGAV